ncbi:MAG: IS1595 family transposase [Alphaproteobacteria bacterium]|nr:IS1595 family transposase [Alphaproteobacteria bacterium]
MARGPGKAFCKGIALVELIRSCPDDEAAKQWFVDMRWPDGVCCPKCGCDRIQCGGAHKSQDYRCRDCRRWFSVKTETVMQGSNLGYRTWLVAIYLMSASLKGVVSMKLHRDLGITQKSAWHLAHRIRECWDEDGEIPFIGPVEADETRVDGKRGNMSKAKRKELAGLAGKRLRYRDLIGDNGLSSGARTA